MFLHELFQDAGGFRIKAAKGFIQNENLCDRIGIIKDGVLIACDSLENLKKHSDSSLEDIFMELTEDE